MSCLRFSERLAKAIVTNSTPRDAKKTLLEIGKAFRQKGLAIPVKRSREDVREIDCAGQFLILELDDQQKFRMRSLLGQKSWTEAEKKQFLDLCKFFLEVGI